MPPPRPTPQRVAHLLPPSLLADLLAPSYATAHNREAGEVYDEVKKGLEGSNVCPGLCDAIWKAMQANHPEKDEAALLDHLAAALAKKSGTRPGSANQTALESMTALLAAIDLPIGRASDATRQALESPNGKKMLAQAFGVAAQFLAKRWR